MDYTGEQKSSLNSINYSLDEYCINIVETVKYELDQSNIDHPIIVTESGRACIASSSMLIFNILETTNFDSEKKQEINSKDHPLLKNMIQIPEYLNLERAQECLNDLNYYREEIRALFRSGQINLSNMAKTEESYLYFINKITTLLIVLTAFWISSYIVVKTLLTPEPKKSKCRYYGVKDIVRERPSEEVVNELLISNEQTIWNWI